MRGAVFGGREKPDEPMARKTPAAVGAAAGARGVLRRAEREEPITSRSESPRKILSALPAIEWRDRALPDRFSTALIELIRREHADDLEGASSGTTLP
jgi:hypothetical protein